MLKTANKKICAQVVRVPCNVITRISFDEPSFSAQLHIAHGEILQEQ